MELNLLVLITGWIPIAAGIAFLTERKRPTRVASPIPVISYLPVQDRPRPE